MNPDKQEKEKPGEACLVKSDDLLLHEILHGESKKLELKIKLPDDSRKYIKTIIAFSNTAGGKLIIGVDDERKVIGLPGDQIFSIKDIITDTISNMCEPQIIPDIYIAEIEGKRIIVVDIYPGPNCPYYIKSLGLQNGTYIRISGLSKLADDTTIKELQFRGSNLRFDEIVNLQQPAEKQSIDRLCQDITTMRMKMVNAEESKSIHSVEVKDLVNWKVLVQNGKEYLATNAFVLLTSDYFEYARIQCARFKGIDRTIFIDKKEYSGPLYEQIENAYNFILNHINLAVGIDGLQRNERYELPTRSIREMIVNAVTHRNYMIDSRIQVAVYDDRIEVTSPGMLFGSLDIAAIKAGRSETRNRTIARVFDKMRLIESWGTGIRRMIEDCAQLKLPEPVFTEIGDAFRVEIYRKQSVQPATGRASTEQVPSKYRASTEQVTEERIKELIEYCSTPRKRSEMQAFLGLTHREHFREAILQPLLDKGLIQPTIPDKPTSSYQRYVKANMEL